MASDGLPAAPPAQLKAVQTYMKIAQDVERVDPVISYWLRLYSTETALKIDRESPECKSFLSALIVWLEKFKLTHKENEAVSNQTVGQAHYENFVMALFNKADTLDRAGTANTSTVRMFFTAAVLFEAMAVFGAVTDDVNQKAKYAKFKAAYIQKCLKAGQTPKPGPIDGSDLEGSSEANPPTAGQNADGEKPSLPPMPPSSGPVDKPAEKPADKPADELTFKPSMPPTMPSPRRPTETTTHKPDDAPSHGSLGDAKFVASNGAPLGPEAILLGQKYCKFANSALQYDDIPTAVENLQKALKLLTTGQNPN